MNMELTTSGPTLNRYSLTTPSCPHALDVLRFEGLEQLSVQKGQIFEGRTDAEGKTASVYTALPESLKAELL